MIGLYAIILGISLKGGELNWLRGKTKREFCHVHVDLCRLLANLGKKWTQRDLPVANFH